MYIGVLYHVYRSLTPGGLKCTHQTHGFRDIAVFNPVNLLMLGRLDFFKL